MDLAPRILRLTNLPFGPSEPSDRLVEDSEACRQQDRQTLQHAVEEIRAEVPKAVYDWREREKWVVMYEVVDHLETMMVPRNER